MEEMEEIRMNRMRIIEWNKNTIESFEVTVMKAMEEDYEGILVQSPVSLTKTIQIKKKNQSFLFLGQEKDEEKIVIQGIGHCLFQITGKRSKITFQNLILRHEMTAPDKREIGGVIFAMGYSQVEMKECNLFSSYGFGLWGVQNSYCQLTNCSITSQERSGCVFFGKSSLYLNSCQIRSCGQHGICVRGQVSLVIDHCLITDCRVRGIYCYDKSKVFISNSKISSTQSSNHAALEIWGGLSPVSISSVSDDKCSLERRFKRDPISLSSQPLTVTLQHVVFYQNNGFSIRYRDNVQLFFQDVFFYHPYLRMCFPVHSHLFLCKSNPPIYPSSYLGLIVIADQLEMIDDDDDSLLEVEPENRNKCIEWEYLVNDEEWRRYSDNCNQYLTLKYGQWKQSLQMSNEDAEMKDAEFFQLPEPFEYYKVNLFKMEQINERTHFTRRVRRKEFIADT